MSMDAVCKATIVLSRSAAFFQRAQFLRRELIIAMLLLLCFFIHGSRCRMVVMERIIA
jgi:hypothetical protein